MPNNPFSSDYAGTTPTQAVVAPVVVKPVVVTAAAPEQAAGIVVEHGFKITPIPTVTGKPWRVIIRGKVTSD